MKNVVIGTAGHIDHGKTTLIKALTGRETDRLKQEKDRGISIELGFTYFDLPSGKRAGIIDVPGHERFIKNMLAGVIGMDIVALVVAADEGVMPQTKEHLDILNLLDIKLGITVITKSELVDDEWLELVKEDIKDSIKGTFLEDGPMVAVDSISRKGIDELIDTIEELSQRVEDRNILETPRLPVDRIFTVTGFGTVVTGTLISGRFAEGQDIQIFPGKKLGRIRSIQVHGEDSKEAFAGQRVAINISGLKKTDIDRGDIVAPVDSMEETMMLDVKLNLLKDSQRIIDNRTRLRVYLGTREVLCRTVFLDRDHLTPGESCYAQLRLEEKVVAKRGDKFIVRFYSPMMTIGGGEILEPNPPKRKRFREDVIEELKIKETGDISDIVEKIISDKSKDFPSIKEISTYTVMPEKKVNELINVLKEKKRVITFTLLKDIHVIHIDYFNSLVEKIRDDLESFHSKNPLKAGMAKEELRSRYLSNIKPKLGDYFINLLINKEILSQNNESVYIKGFEVKFNKEQNKIKECILEVYFKDKFTPHKVEDVSSKLKFNDKDISQVYEALFDLGVIIRLKDGITIHESVYSEAIQKVKGYIKDNGHITVGECRDLFDTSRKFAIALLEDFDTKKITKRVEDKRILF